MDEDLQCGVCGEGFGNAGALATHEALTKDAPHLAKRAGAPASLAPSPPPPPPVPASPAPLAGPPLALPLSPIVRAGEAGEARPDEARGEAGEAQAEPAFLIALPPPPNVRPLLPDGGSGNGSEATAQAVPALTVDLEPLVAGSVALLGNAFLLNDADDEKLTVDEAKATQFPKAVEACVKHYYPGVQWDHPAVALIASGITLSLLVAAKKGAKKAKPQQSASPQAGEAQAQGEAGMAEGPRSPAPLKNESGATGDPYWDSILKSVGGGASHDD